MLKSGDKIVFCPHCGKQFDSRGFDNHVTSCRKTSRAESRKSSRKPPKAKG